MRAILILGVMLMPWQDDMQAVSSAIAQQGPQQAQAAPPQAAPRGISEEDHAALSVLLQSGRITPQEYEARSGMNSPPPGVDPAQWRRKLEPFKAPPTEWWETHGADPERAIRDAARARRTNR